MTAVGPAGSASAQEGEGDLITRLKNVEEERKQAVSDFARVHRVNMAGVRKGSAFMLVRIANGHPIYRTTHNLAAGLAARVPDVRASGGLGVDLRGLGRNVGLWDAGTPLSSHVELSGRIQILDESSSPANHATHVAGTLAAAGVRGEVEGMAPLAVVQARDWQNDEVEMASAAAQGLLVSSHSYGTFGGWVEDLRGTGRWSWMGNPAVSVNEDHRFGLYGREAATWDAIAHAHPNYVVVKSAGNERADLGPLPGEPYDIFDGEWTTSTIPRAADGGLDGYDSILDAGLGKNVLTIGAVEDLDGRYVEPADVVMSTFSGWGPADDGRIKPDLVANGTSVLSSVAGWNEAYAFSSGTSMATPVAAGVVTLVQEAFEDHLGQVPSAAFIRALLIHTADEAGLHPGPDYRFGWGLINAARAVSMVIQEASDPGRFITGVLEPGQSIAFEIEVAAGEPIAATLAWTDPPAPEAALRLNDRTPRLVNDLDLLVLGPDGDFLPFVLDPESPENPASRSINRVDTVEQVKADATAPGSYTVVVSLAPQAASDQAFSVVLGGEERQESPAGWLAGRVFVAGEGLGGVEIVADGQRRTSAADGSFLFSDLPAGTVSVVPDPSLGFRPDTAWVRIPEDSYVEFHADSRVWVADLQLFSSPRLLRPDEWVSRTEVQSTAAGGVYGLNLFLETAPGVDLAGARVIADFESSPAGRVYAGSLGERFQASDPVWTLSPTGPQSWFKRIPILWQAPNRPSESVRVPIEVVGISGLVLGRDTLAWTLDRPDDLAPIIFPRIEVHGRGFAQSPLQVIFRADAIDGSPVTEFTAHLWERDADNLIEVVPMYDDGLWARHGDAIASDRLFGAVYTPEPELDYRVDYRAVDAAGNVADAPASWYFSSRTFTVDSPHLLLTWSQAEADTDAHRRALAEAGIEHDWWEFDVRSQVPDSLLSRYQAVVWSWHERVITRIEDRVQIEDLVEAEVPLVLVGSGIDEGGWLGSFSDLTRTGSDPSTTLIGSADSSWSGSSFSVLPGLTPTWSSTSGTPLLATEAGAVVAARLGRMVVSGVSPLRIPEGQRANYMRRLLQSASGRGGVTTGLETLHDLVFTLDYPYPNPASSKTTVEFRLPQASTVELLVYDLTGRMARQNHIGPLVRGTHSYTVDLADLAPGVYFLSLRNRGRQVTRPLVVVAGQSQ